jgi:hypothetical protein
MHHRGPARLSADHLDQVAQETGTPGAVKGTEHEPATSLCAADENIHAERE